MTVPPVTEKEEKYLPIDELDEDVRSLVRDGLRAYKHCKEAQDHADAFKREYYGFLLPVLESLGGAGVRVPGFGSVSYNQGQRSTLDKDKLRELLLVNLIHVPSIDLIIAECFKEASKLSASSPYPVVRMEKGG